MFTPVEDRLATSIEKTERPIIITIARTTTAIAEDKLMFPLRNIKTSTDILAINRTPISEYAPNHELKPKVSVVGAGAPPHLKVTTFIDVCVVLNWQTVAVLFQAQAPPPLKETEFGIGLFGR